jgi:hypothetical protein
MTRLSRVVLIMAPLALILPLAACESFDIEKYTDFEIFNTKKKLPGDRKPVFPSGVPGVTQGVPEELKKGYQQPPEPATPAPAAQAGEGQGQRDGQAQAEGEQPAAKPKPKKPVKVAKPKPQPQTEPQDQSQAQPAQTSPWPAQQPQQQQQQQSGWPSGPGTISR